MPRSKDQASDLSPLQVRTELALLFATGVRRLWWKRKKEEKAQAAEGEKISESHPDRLELS